MVDIQPENKCEHDDSSSYFFFIHLSSMEIWDPFGAQHVRATVTFLANTK